MAPSNGLHSEFSPLRMHVGGIDTFVDGQEVARVFFASDYAGCAQAQRSTIGAVAVRARAGSSTPLSFLSKRQSCVSRSTSAAEIVALDMGLCVLASPLLRLIDEIFGATRAQAAGGNQSMLSNPKTGRVSTVRHLARTRRVSVAWPHELHVPENVDFPCLDRRHGS